MLNDRFNWKAQKDLKVTQGYTSRRTHTKPMAEQTTPNKSSSQCLDLERAPYFSPPGQEWQRLGRGTRLQTTSHTRARSILSAASSCRAPNNMVHKNRGNNLRECSTEQGTFQPIKCAINDTSYSHRLLLSEKQPQHRPCAARAPLTIFSCFFYSRFVLRCIWTKAH